MPAAKRPRAVVQSSTSATKRAIVNERASFASVTTFASNFSHQTLSCSCEMPGASLGSGTPAAPAGAAASARHDRCTCWRCRRRRHWHGHRHSRSRNLRRSCSLRRSCCAHLQPRPQACHARAAPLLHCSVLRCRRSDEPPAILHAALTCEPPGPLLQRP